jgi:hypothetical protein
MSYLSSRKILKKADDVITNLISKGGFLLEGHAVSFMKLLAEEPELMKFVTVVPMWEYVMKKIKFVKFGDPDYSTLVLNTNFFKATVCFSDESLAGIIERDDLGMFLMKMIAKEIARDLKEVIINGDKTSSDPLLAVLNGILVQAKTNIVDAKNSPITEDILSDMVKMLPDSSYINENIKSMNFFISDNAYIGHCINLKKDLTNMDRDDIFHLGPNSTHMPIKSISVMPDDLGDRKNQTTILLCDPKSIYVGFWKKFKVDTIIDLSDGILEVNVILRIDVKYSEEKEVVKSINVQV